MRAASGRVKHWQHKPPYSSNSPGGDCADSSERRAFFVDPTTLTTEGLTMMKKPAKSPMPMKPSKPPKKPMK